MRNLIITCFLTLGIASGAQAAVLTFEDRFATIVGDASVVDFNGDLDLDVFNDDHPASALPLFGDATALSLAGGFSSADASAFVDDGFVSINAQLFGDVDESAMANAFADYNATVTGTGGLVTLLVDVDHQAAAFGDDATGDTWLTIDVFDVMSGSMLIQTLMLPLGTGDVRAMFDPTFRLAAGAMADIVMTLTGEFAASLESDLFSVTSVSFSAVETAVEAAVPATPTFMLLLVAAFGVIVTRRRATGAFTDS